LKALYAGLFGVVRGFALAVTVGVSLGVAMARIRFVKNFFDPLVEFRASPSSCSPFFGSASATGQRSS
jgi:ABC-type nitrate/sulfonate/bicarbonate transport system permease component